MKASDLGEFGLIDRLAEKLGRSGPEALIAGIGEDAAAWRTAAGDVLLATTDSLLADVHFLPERAPWRDLGWKALAVSIADIAAMGGSPDFALVTLGLPPDLPVAAVDDIYDGLRECADAYATAVVGGDVVRAEAPFLTTAVLGHADLDGEGRPLLLRRDGAGAGYALAVTGSLGDSAAGLRLLSKGAALYVPLVRAHLRPRPPLAAAREAARMGMPCAIDISDGLLQDLGHICRGSGLGAVVHADRLPLSDELRHTFPQDAVGLAAAGGEDYQLLLAAPIEALEALAGRIDAPLSVVGETVADPERRVRLLDAAGADIAPTVAGWDHLRPA